MIAITADVAISEQDVVFTASRSGGPGGQNVNKVSSRVTLSFDLSKCSALTAGQKARISEKLRSRINKDGILRIVSQKTRSQDMNRADAIERFAELLQQALFVEPARVKTRPTKASKEKRLEQKKQRTGLKKERSQKGWPD